MLLCTALLAVAVAAAANPVADEQLVAAHVAASANATFRRPSGKLRFPYLVPAGPYNEMWDWDSLFMGVALVDYGSLPYFSGTFLCVPSRCGACTCCYCACAAAAPPVLLLLLLLSDLLDRPPSTS
jgi:hypothetical protein